MHFKVSLTWTTVLLACSHVLAKSSWGFNDATVAIHTKGSGVGAAAAKEKLSESSPLSQELSLGSSDTLKLLLTTTQDQSPKRPHQAFLALSDESSGLEESFPLSVKESGKGKLDLTHKELPAQLLATDSPLTASIMIASFGSSTPYQSKAFSLRINRDSPTPAAIPEPPTRYSALPEIRHIFKSDPKSPPVMITALFTFPVFMALPVLFGVWMEIGLTFDHLTEAFTNAPVAHSLFLGSLVALEFVFFFYYVSWSLFRTLPVAAVVGSVAFVSGSKALREVQARRLAGKR